MVEERSTLTYLKCHVVLYTECTGSYDATGNDPNWSVQWTVRGDIIDFSVSAQTTGWVGIGFSANTGMVSSYAYTHNFNFNIIY